MVPRHPDLGSFTGLRCSIIETINCSFLPTGQVNKFDSHGEIACAYQRDDEISDPKPRQLKLSGRNHIDRVVPSPSLLTANEMRGLEDEEAYELRVNLLSRQPVVALRYHLKAQPESTVPILLRPAWKIDNKTAGIILHYSINPSYTLHHPSPSITLKNFILIASITSNDTIPAISCQSKPAGVFSRERGIVYWRLGDVSLSTAEPSGNKVVARFMLTPGENPAAKPGNVEARFEIPGALATGDDQQRDLAGSSHPSVGLMECEFTEPKGKEKEIVGDADRDPFADEGEPDGTSTPTPARMRAENWRAVQGVRKVVSGRYLVVSEESRTG